ncbi:SH3 domain-containing protein [Zoogloea sp. 1C4]|uniref:SH3 domain-containing protein n=1 Tax=Zoogloea sp. 1C4 TaxID=2570190 RepID=UPI0012925E60|nr:SH3 domain-containing protein [Zoogloea sp. 1C4]
MRLSKPAIFLSLCLASMAGLAADTATLTAPEKLRADPTPYAAVVGAVHRLATVRIVDERRDWYRVEADGGRSGWLPRQSLQLDTPAPAAARASQPSPGSDARLVPRSTPRASNHALLLSLDPARARADGEAAAAIARLMGVPDANLQQPPAAQLDADGLRRALAALDARLGTDDRAFIHLSGAGGNPPCADAIPTAGGGALPLPEFTGFLKSLARKADKLVVVADAGDGRCPAPSISAGGAGNTLTLSGPRGSTQALRDCLDGRTPLTASGGIATGEDWRHCAQAALGAGRITLGGNPSIAPAPGLAVTTQTSPRKLLQAIHAQRSERRNVIVGGMRGSYRASETIRVSVSGPQSGQLYLLAARDDGFALLHPSPAAPAERFTGSQSVSLAARDMGSGNVRLLALVTDSPRNFMRAGFSGSGNVATAPADARSLRDLPLEILGGDTSLTCQRAETRNLGAAQARQCSTAFGSAIADLSISP